MNSVQSTGHTGSMSKKDSQIEVTTSKPTYTIYHLLTSIKKAHTHTVLRNFSINNISRPQDKYSKNRFCAPCNFERPISSSIVRARAHEAFLWEATKHAACIEEIGAKTERRVWLCVCVIEMKFILHINTHVLLSLVFEPKFNGKIRYAMEIVERKSFDSSSKDCYAFPNAFLLCVCNARSIRW